MCLSLLNINNMGIKTSEIETTENGIIVKTERFIEMDNRDEINSALVMGNSIDLISKIANDLLTEKQRLEDDGYEIKDFSLESNNFRAIKHHKNGE